MTDIVKSTDVTKSIEDEIFKNELELTIEYADLDLEGIFENEVLKHIPVVKSLVAFYSITNSFVTRHNVKKLLVFLNEFQRNKVDPGKLEDFKKRFHNNPKYRSEVLETILVLNEKFINIRQSEVFANLFKSHIEGLIDWDEFNSLSFVINSLNPSGYKVLETLSTESWFYHGRKHPAEEESIMFASGIGHRDGTKFIITETGKRLFEYGIKATLISKP